MATKYRYSNAAVNSYAMAQGTGEDAYSYAAMQQAEEEKNVKAGKTAVKVTGIIVALVILAHTLTGCVVKDNGNPVQGAVCAFQNTPSLVCPNAGK